MYNQQTNKIKPPLLDDDVDSFMQQRAKAPAVPKAAPSDDVDAFMSKRATPAPTPFTGGRKTSPGDLAKYPVPVSVPSLASDKNAKASPVGYYDTPSVDDPDSPVGRASSIWAGTDTDASGRETGAGMTHFKKPGVAPRSRPVDPRSRQAAQVARRINEQRNEATRLFKQADATPMERMGGAFDNQQQLRAQAEGKLEQANILAKNAQRDFGDVLEVGFGKDADPNSKRQWAYAKPKAPKAMEENDALAIRARDVERPADPRIQRRLLDQRTTMQKAASPGPKFQQFTPPEEAPGWVGDKVSRFGRAAVGTIPGAISGTAKLADAMYGGLQRMTGNWLPEAADWSPVVTPAMESAQKGIEDTLPVDPSRNEDFSSKIASGFGSAAGFGKIGGAARALGLPFKAAIGAAGVGFGADEIAREMKDAGFRRELDPARYDRAVMMGGATGLTELIGLGKTLERFGLKRAALQRGVEVLENSGQEAFQQWMGNVNAANVGAYDLDREQGKGVLEAAILGGIVSGGVQAADLGMQSAQPASIPEQLASRTLTNQNTAIRAERAPMSDIVPTAAPGPTNVIPLRPAAQTAAPVPATPIPAIDPTVTIPKSTNEPTEPATIAAESPSALPRLPEPEGFNARRAKMLGMALPSEIKINEQIQQADRLATSPSEADQKFGQRMLKETLAQIQTSEGYQTELGLPDDTPKPYTAVRAAIEVRLKPAPKQASEEERIAKLEELNQKLTPKIESEELDQISRRQKLQQQEVERQQKLQNQQAVKGIQNEARTDIAGLKQEQAAAQEAERQRKIQERASVMDVRSGARQEIRSVKQEQAIAREQEKQQVNEQARQQKNRVILKLRDDADAAEVAADEHSANRNHAEAMKSLATAKKSLQELQRKVGTASTGAVALRKTLHQHVLDLDARIRETRASLAADVKAGIKPTKPLTAPLLRPEAVQNPEGGIPEMPEQTFSGRLQQGINQQETQKPAAPIEQAVVPIEERTGNTVDLTLKPKHQSAKSAKPKPAKRLISRVAELGGISNRYAGELQGVKDARRVGVVRGKPMMSPDILARQLQSEGYDIDPENLDTLWEAIRRDGVDKNERPANTADLNQRLKKEEEAHYAQQEPSKPFDEIAAEVDANIGDNRTLLSAFQKLNTDDPAVIGKMLRGADRRYRLSSTEGERAADQAAHDRVRTLTPEEHSALAEILPEQGFYPSKEDHPAGRGDYSRAVSDFAQSETLGAQGEANFDEVMNFFDNLTESDKAISDADIQAVRESVANAKWAANVASEYAKDIPTLAAIAAKQDGESVRWMQLYDKLQTGAKLNETETATFNTISRKLGLSAKFIRGTIASSGRTIASDKKQNQPVERAAQVERPSAVSRPEPSPIKTGDSVTWQVNGKAVSGKVAKVNGQYVTAETADGQTITRDKSKFTGVGDNAPSLPSVSKSDRAPEANYWKTPRVESAPVTDEDGQKVVADSRVEFRQSKRGGGTLWTNHQAAIVIASAANQTGADLGAASGFAGLSMSHQTVMMTADLLREKADDYGADGKRLTEIADALEAAQQDAIANNRDDVVIADSTSADNLSEAKRLLREERFHSWQRSAGLFDKNVSRALDATLGRNPIYRRIKKALLEEGYNDNPRILTTEAAAKAASGQWERYGLKSEDEALDFLNEYYKASARMLGVDALMENAPATPQARKVQENVRNEERVRLGSRIQSAETARGRDVQGSVNAPSVGRRNEEWREGRSEEANASGVSKGKRSNFGSLANEPVGEVLGAFPGNIQNLFSRKPKDAKPETSIPIPKDWDASKWAKKIYTDAMVNALSPKDRAEYGKLKTDKQRAAYLMGANVDPDIEAKVFKLIDRAADALENGNGDEVAAARKEAKELLSGQVSPSDRDVKWYDHLQSRLSNVNFKGTYERIAGEQGKEISEIFRNAQVDAASGKITRSETVKRLHQELRPYTRRLKSAGKPGLARWIETHIDDVSDPDQSFRGLAGFLKGFQYNTKLRLNPRSALINTLQPLQTLWPHLTTREWAKIQYEAAKPSTWRRVSEIAARESGGSVENVNDQKRFMGWADLFSPVSEYNRIVGHLAGELFADRNGLTGDAKARMAADWAKKVEFDNSAYDIPPLFSGKIAGVVGQFKPFMVKNMERLYSDWKSAPPEALATNTWKGAGTLARRSKMITAQLAIGGVRSAIPGLKTIGGVLVLGALAKGFGKFFDDDKAEKLAEAVYFGAPALVEQDLSGSVAIFDEPFGKTAYEKLVNFGGGPTLSLIAKAYEEGKKINEAEDSKNSTKTEKQKAAGMRLAKAITPYMKTAETAYDLATGKQPELFLGKPQPMSKMEIGGKLLMGTPLRQSKYYEHKEAFDWQKKLMPERFPKEEKGQQLPKAGESLSPSTPKRRTGEPDAIFQQRKERVEGWMSTYGDKLLASPRFNAASEADKKAAIELLRERIGRQQNLVKPNLAGFEPNAVLLGAKRSATGKAKRQSKYLYSQP